ncbi:hypothetical protein N825_02845 [Skermanella stibiiresistens SB22]|uniref:AAA+ family ATPase n=1 Tax=Skermanella stibiiresistens SB22 TaxID=1385369 RepID=W9H616_9PROT|nr:hypothetical protein [Skermanella stibiiresistens]EWY40122.1 hypothetical protein N825_02845 [Skermanella stibiiresistens SB22]
MRLQILTLCAYVILATAPAAAQSVSPVPPEPSATELTMQGLTKLMLGLQRMVEELPRYGLPEITENGDIVIRRVDPKPVPDAPHTRPSSPGGVDL